MSKSLIGGAMLGSAQFLPPLGMGLVVGGALALMLMRWHQIRALRHMMEEIAWLEQMDHDGNDEAWRKIAEE